MASVNKVILVGNCGSDPKVSRQGETIVANVSIATTERYKDKQGVSKELTEWHRLVFFGKLAEIVESYVKKGSSIYIEGKLKTTKWLDKNTKNARYSTDIVVNLMQLLGNKSTVNDPTPAVDQTENTTTEQSESALADMTEEYLG
jgi:single-strand DNA-binding protein